MAELRKNAMAEGADAEPPPTRRTSPVEFYKQVVREAKKVTWPSWKETWLTTMMVFIMVGVTMVFFAIVDFLLQYGECLLIGCVKQ
jgi:preprotein translocase subunit SecE